MNQAFQDLYADRFSHCYGCGRNNHSGHQLKSYWDGDGTIARFSPAPQYSGGVPDHVYGGLIASLFDCHGTASAAAFIGRTQPAQATDNDMPIRCVTASLKVDFRRPTPMGVELVITGKLRTIEGRKVWIDMELRAADQVCATADMLAIRLQD